MTTAWPVAGAARRVSDAAAVVKRDVSRQEDHLALSDLEAEPVNSMSSSTRQNNKARHVTVTQLCTLYKIIAKHFLRYIQSV